jgi:hypothetical protein
MLRRRVVWRLVLLLGWASFAVGCKSRIGALRDALADDDVTRAAGVVSAPVCTGAAGEKCVDALATAFGGKHGFDVRDPDNASAAAVAVLVVRDKRGDLAVDADRWIAAMTIAHGDAADALRLAVAHNMAELAPRIGKRIDDEAEATAMVHDVAAALPGSCPTYVAMASTPIEKMAPAERPDHSPCVQRDLERKDGPGAKYGYGVWRAASGVAALWKDEARALRSGLAAASPSTRAVVGKRLAVIDAASGKIDLKKVEAPGRVWMQGPEGPGGGHL